MRQTCPTCRGTGEIIKNPCRKCNGQGRVKSKRTLTLKIPSGVETGSRLRLRGKGEGGVQGGPAGDLYVIIHVKGHEVFQRHDDDLFCEVPLPFHIAATGGELEVPTLEGFAKLKIPAGTPSGKVFRLKNKGIKAGGRGQGDQHVRVTVEVPTHLNGSQKKALQGFAETLKSSQQDQSEALQKHMKKFYERKQALENT